MISLCCLKPSVLIIVVAIVTVRSIPEGDIVVQVCVLLVPSALFNLKFAPVLFSKFLLCEVRIVDVEGEVVIVPGVATKQYRAGVLRDRLKI